MVDFRVPELLRRARTVARGLYTQATWRPEDTHTVLVELARQATARPDAQALWFQGRTLTYRALDAAVNQHAQRWLAVGVQRGDVVAVMLPNRPEFLFHLYGLGRIGAVAALINTNLGGPSLAHAVQSAGARAMVVDPAFRDAVAGAGIVLSEGMAFVDDAAADAGEVPSPWRRWDASEAASMAPSVARPPTLGDVFAYIYTSGTTGKPKPAIVKHHRFWRAGRMAAAGLTLTRDSGVYCCLPLYHANGVVIAATAAFSTGARFVLAPRFSARRFWDDVYDGRATHFIYIGEVCRYLLAAAPHPRERAHGIEAAIGNGLRADVWDAFVARFGVERIVEFYGSTEGNAETANVLGVSGSCGVLLPGRMALVRYDVAADAVVRNRRGRCERVAAGEPGLLLGRIAPDNEFAGYTDRAATERKVLRDVFAQGDAWFDTGDLLRRDHLRRLYFVDRLGDTFRWKGENVATTEVAEALSGAPGVRECVVYGVAVPGAEGQAGMAAVVLADGAEFDAQGQVVAALAERLPSYAWPRFVRRVEHLEVTGTFKHRKGELKRDGFDRGRVGGDGLWVLDLTSRRYIRLDDARAEAVAAGKYPL